MKSRIVLLFLIFFLAWVSLVAKSFFLQVLPDEKLAKLQKKQFEKIVTLKPRRGAIVDRKGRELAVSVPSYSLYADPSQIDTPKQIARKLAKELRSSFRNIYRKLLQEERKFIWLDRQLAKKKMEKIKKWKLKGIGFIEEPRRVYPAENILAQALGFVGRDGEGLEGLELKYNEVLGGNKRKVQLQRDARGRPLLINGRFFSEYPMGSDIKLTIDANTQYFLEKELEFSVEKHDADSAVGVVVDAKTSEVLAMANVPVFSSNKPQIYDASYRRNRAVTDSYEPGSTMKTFVVAATLMHGTAKPNSRIFCEDGKFKIGRRTIRESDNKHNFGWLSVSEILAQSSNIGSAKLAFKLGDQKLRKTLLDFGFGSKPDISLPGPSKGILHKLPWNKHLLSNISFGHGMTANPLQVTMAYSAIANGGVLYSPLIVKSVFNEVSGDNTQFKAKRLRRVMRKEQAETLRLMLMSATSRKATGFNARVPGYPVAGKTGTAQKVKINSRGYSKGDYIASFAGFIPANDPKYVIYIAVDNPRKGYYGSEVAAPVFSKVASHLVRKGGIEPILISKKDLVKTKVTKIKPQLRKSFLTKSRGLKGLTPNLIGLSLREVMRRARKLKLDLRIKGSGIVAKTWPPPGEKLPKSKRITLLLEP